MYDPELNKWFQVPNDKCVLWLGSAASDLSGGRVKAGTMIVFVSCDILCFVSFDTDRYVSDAGSKSYHLSHWNANIPFLLHKLFDQISATFLSAQATDESRKLRRDIKCFLEESRRWLLKMLLPVHWFPEVYKSTIRNYFRFPSVFVDGTLTQQNLSILEMFYVRSYQLMPRYVAGELLWYPIASDYLSKNEKMVVLKF